MALLGDHHILYIRKLKVKSFICNRTARLKPITERGPLPPGHWTLSKAKIPTKQSESLNKAVLSLRTKDPDSRHRLAALHTILMSLSHAALHTTHMPLSHSALHTTHIPLSHSAPHTTHMPLYNMPPHHLTYRTTI